MRCRTDHAPPGRHCQPEQRERVEGSASAATCALGTLDLPVATSSAYVPAAWECVFSGAYGWATRRWAVPVSLATRFDTASITKLFTAVAALQLIGEGRLGLDTSIVEVVDLTGTTISPAVTVRHLLTHTSGIADDADEEAGEDYEALCAAEGVSSTSSGGRPGRSEPDRRGRLPA